MQYDSEKCAEAAISTVCKPHVDYLLLIPDKMSRMLFVIEEGGVIQGKLDGHLVSQVAA